MTHLTTAFVTECMKLRRSKIFWITISLFIFIPAMVGIMIFVTLHPEIGKKLGMIGTKASMLRMGNTNWASYFGLINQVGAGIGLVGFGFITSWVFGREFSDHTAKDIMALPVSRSSIVISKFIVVFLWSVLLSGVLLVTSFLVGWILHIPGWSNEVIGSNVATFLVVFLLTALLCTPVAFLASYSKGYLLPMAFIILTMIIANFVGLVGLGPYFPWAIPGLYGTASSEQAMQLITASYIILISTSALGLFGTLSWWRYADQH